MTEPTDPAAGQVAALTPALETLVAELERESQWLAELRDDAERTAARCHRLLSAAQATMEALPITGRRPFWVRVRRIHAELLRQGRPPRDGRQTAMLDYIVNAGGGGFSNAELRQHLIGAGIPAAPKYVSNQLGAFAREGLISRLGHGLWRVETNSVPFTSARFRLDRAASVRAMRGEIDRLRGHARARVNNWEERDDATDELP